MQRSIWIGYDRREESAFQVCRGSMLRRMSSAIPVHALELEALKSRGLYRRPMARSDGRLIDVLSIRPDYDGSMSTDHALARFFVPELARDGWALFMDGDMMARSDIARVFENLDATKALYCVQHDHLPTSAVKMDGQIQTAYPRKNWSSFMIFNCNHRAHERLKQVINTRPGRDLHRFCWLMDNEIGRLDASWNFLVGHTNPEIKPDVVHFTDGVPNMPGYENVPYADEWRAELQRKAA